MVGYVANKVWTILSWRELVFMKEEDVGFKAGTLVLFVVDEVDSLQVFCHDDRR